MIESLRLEDSVLDPDWIRIQPAQWIRIWIRNPDSDPGGQKRPTKIEKDKTFYVLKCWMFSFEAEGFSCSLGVLYKGLGISKL